LKDISSVTGDRFRISRFTASALAVVSETVHVLLQQSGNCREASHDALRLGMSKRAGSVHGPGDYAQYCEQDCTDYVKTQFDSGKFNYESHCDRHDNGCQTIGSGSQTYAEALFFGIGGFRQN
jgi:hypothetical protein